MTDGDPQKSPIQSWFTERKLPQILAVYAATSWAILEVTDVFIDKLGLPDWFFPAALVLLLIGLAVVTVTALVQGGSGRQGERRKAEAPVLFTLTWSKAVLGGVLAFSALAVTGAIWLATRSAGDEAVVAAPNAVAVLPFRTTGAGLEVWREGLMDVLAANLDGAGTLRAVDTRTVLGRWKSRVGEADASTEEAIAVARGLGSRWAVHGQAVELGGQVRLDARFYETANGEQVAASSVVGAPDSILPLIEGVTLELLRGLGEAQGLGDRGRALTSTSLEAVKSFLEGEQAMRRSEWVAASEAFERALEIDSTFAMAAARLSQAYGWRYSAGHPAVVEAAERAFRLADQLPARERGLLELNHLIEQGRYEAIDLARQLTARYPDDPDIWFQQGEAYYHLGFITSVPDAERMRPFERALALDSSNTVPLIHMVEVAAELRDMEAFDQYTQVFLARDSTSGEAVRLRTAHALVRGPSSDSLDAVARLKEMSISDLQQTLLKLRDPSWHEARLLILDELEAPRHPAADRANVHYFWRNLFETWRGRPSVAQAALDQAQELDPNRAALWFYQLSNIGVGMADTARVGRATQRSRELGVLDTPTGRWALGAYYLRIGDYARVSATADTIAMQADSLRVAGDSLGARQAEGLAQGLLGVLAERRGDYPEAVRILRRSVLMSGGLGEEWTAIDEQRVALASALTELGEESEALRILESGFRFEGYWSFRAILFRAQLYERRGDRESAIRDYAWVSDILEYCDPEFVPQREAAQRALSRLLAEG
ncbi:MAG TPA: hypothetical protein VLC48_08560 [Gemmatimonadota bacterium]|nr:hypothetical protein [Gemmatimonadota bacterium]